MGKLSTGFTGSTTRSLDELEREIEYRLGQMRTEAFAEVVHPSTVKGTGPYSQAHDDSSSADSTSSLAAAGNAKDQEELDMIDEIEDKFQKPIKKPSAQFPGSKLSASDNAGFDSHQTDPAKLGAKKMANEIRYWKGDKAKYTGVKKEMHGGMFYEIEMLEGHMKGEKKWVVDPPEAKKMSTSDSFDKVGAHIEKKMKRLSAPNWIKPHSKQTRIPFKGGDLYIAMRNEDETWSYVAQVGRSTESGMGYATHDRAVRDGKETIEAMLKS